MIYIIILGYEQRYFDRKWLGGRPSAAWGTYIYMEKHTDREY